MKKTTASFPLRTLRFVWFRIIVPLCMLVFLLCKLICYTVPKKIIISIQQSRNRAVIHEHEQQLQEKRESMAPFYQPFDVLSAQTGVVSAWEKYLASSDSTIGIIVGARGSGKSATGLKILENMHVKTKRRCFAMGFEQDEMPSWITVVEQVDQIPNDVFVLIDEGGVLFSSRKAMAKPNKLLSDLLLIARHKNISIIFIAQNSSNLDVNIIRQADYLLFKRSSLLQKDFERKIIQTIYEEIDFKRFEGKGVTYIYADTFRGFVNIPLPSFWSVKISKSFSAK